MSKKSPSDLHKECRHKAFRARQRYFDKVDKLTKGQCICTDEWLHSHDKEVRKQTIADVEKIINKFENIDIKKLFKNELDEEEIVNYDIGRRAVIFELKEEIKNLASNSQGTKLSSSSRETEATYSGDACESKKDNTSDTRKGCNHCECCSIEECHKCGGVKDA